MRFNFALFAFMQSAAAVGNIFQRAAVCGADNCVRAVTKTASRMTTDCSSFQAVTVCPAVSTATVTSGSVSTTISANGCAATTKSPSNVPAYAQTACSSGVSSLRFASACSCASITKYTIIAATPVATVVVPTPSATRPSCSDVMAAGSYTNTASGKQFTAICDSAYWYVEANALGKYTYALDFTGCIDLCASTPNCVAANYYKGDQNPYKCSLISDTTQGFSNPYANYDSAILVAS